MTRTTRSRSLAINLAIFAVLVAAWEATVRLLGISNLLVPPPSEIADALWAGLAADPAGRLALYVPALETLSEALSGLVIGFAVGLGLAVLMNSVQVIERYAVPYIIGFQALPKIALAPLLVVWFGFGSTSTVVLVATSCFFPILLNALEGFKATDADRIDLLRSMGAGRTEIFREVLIGASAAVSRASLKDPAKRDAIIRFLRVWSKAIVFAKTNPEAAVKTDYAMFPELKPRNLSDAEAVRQGVQAQAAVIPDYSAPHGGKWGQFPDKVLSTYADFLGIKVPDADSLYTNELIDAVNDFDAAAVVQKAKDFK
jgi:ABC-type nitrate/sulfonate/bicarbonate transport system permease component